jgi:hypothetical protein
MRSSELETSFNSSIVGHYELDIVDRRDLAVNELKETKNQCFQPSYLATGLSKK